MRFPRELTPLIFLVLVLALVPKFLQPSNINAVLLWLPLILVVACGEMLVILIRGIDISVGAILGFAGVAVGMLLRAQPTMPIPLALLCGSLVGLLWGLVNGALVSYGRVASVIVTIGSLTAIRGAAHLISGGKQIDSSVVPQGLTALARHGVSLGPILVPWLLILALAVVLATGAFLTQTQAGRNLMAFGSNPDAAHLRGISARRVTMLAFAVSGALAGLAGVMYAAKFGFVNPETAGKGFELNVIAAVAIGGVKMAGGQGRVIGVVIGCALLACVNTALSVLGIDATWQVLSYGAIILVALLTDALLSRREAR